jgi:hypothetical protein
MKSDDEKQLDDIIRETDNNNEANSFSGAPRTFITDKKNPGGSEFVSPKPTPIVHHMSAGNHPTFRQEEEQSERTLTVGQLDDVGIQLEHEHNLIIKNDDNGLDESRLSPKILTRVDVNEGNRHSTTGKKELGGQGTAVTSTAKKIDSNLDFNQQQMQSGFNMVPGAQNS